MKIEVKDVGVFLMGVCLGLLFGVTIAEGNFTILNPSKEIVDAFWRGLGNNWYLIMIVIATVYILTRKSQ
jgi:hypothetical protein